MPKRICKCKALDKRPETWWSDDVRWNPACWAQLRPPQSEPLIGEEEILMQSMQHTDEGVCRKWSPSSSSLTSSDTHIISRVKRQGRGNMNRRRPDGLLCAHLWQTVNLYGLWLIDDEHAMGSLTLTVCLGHHYALWVCHFSAVIVTIVNSLLYWPLSKVCICFWLATNPRKKCSWWNFTL